MPITAMPQSKSSLKRRLSSNKRQKWDCENLFFRRGNIVRLKFYIKIKATQQTNTNKSFSFLLMNVFLIFVICRRDGYFNLPDTNIVFCLSLLSFYIWGSNFHANTTFFIVAFNLILVFFLFSFFSFIPLLFLVISVLIFVKCTRVLPVVFLYLLKCI